MFSTQIKLILISIVLVLIVGCSPLPKEETLLEYLDLCVNAYNNLSTNYNKSFDVIENLIIINHNQFCLNKSFNYMNCKPVCDERIEWLEDVADIYGDTWRESDCGMEISKAQRETGMDNIDTWRKEFKR